MSGLVAVPLPGGQWIALPADQLRAAISAAQNLGLGNTGSTHESEDVVPEPLRNSEQMAELLNIHSTSVEAMAKSGAIPSIRIGTKTLRFERLPVLAALRSRSGDAA